MGNQYLIQGKWEGSSAGGAHKVVLAQEKNKGKKGSNSKKGKEEDPSVLPPKRPDARNGTYIQDDGDVRWFNNPQYRIEVKKETECYITLMQRDARLRGSSSSSYGSEEGKVSGTASTDSTTHFFSDF